MIKYWIQNKKRRQFKLQYFKHTKSKLLPTIHFILIAKNNTDNKITKFYFLLRLTKYNSLNQANILFILLSILPISQHNTFFLQNLSILEGDLPETTDDLTIIGAESLSIEANSLSRLNDARYLHFVNNKYIYIRTSAAVSLNIINLFLEIDNCDVLTVEEKAFHDIKGMFYNFIYITYIEEK